MKFESFGKNQEPKARTEALPGRAAGKNATSAPSHELVTNSQNTSIERQKTIQNAGSRIGEKLVTLGMITEDQLNVALQEKKVSGKLLGEIMVDLGFLDDQSLTKFLADSSGFDVFDPKHTVLDGDALVLIDKVTAMRLQVLPVSLKDDELVIAMSDPYDVIAIDAMRRLVSRTVTIRPVVSTPHNLTDAIDAAYGYASSINAILRELEEGDEQTPDLSNLSEGEVYSHPIVRLVNALVADAVKIGASDLHFEPEENFVRLRYRNDGVLYTAQIMRKNHWSAMSQRLKIMSNMNIADKLSPQDGRFDLNIGGHSVDFRVSSLPTVWGENIVARVLDQSQSIVPLEKLGFSADNRAKIKISQERPEGIIIVTGPTGSGKTTTLYSMLNEINNVEVNIQTMEDPVEYSLPMIRQTPIREGILDFADGIRAILRQDPDIIFIGEIRDGTTAEMALKAAMTGHQVYTTLHTNDSFAAIPRLLDLGLKPGMIAGAIVSIFAQRLVRRICQQCREPHVATTDECVKLKIDPDKAPTIYSAKQGGCHACKGQGYKGRINVAEILLFDDELDDALAKGATKAELKQLALQKGFKSMREDGILKILEGITTIDAVADVVGLTK